jgi:hypothetical protein
MLAGHRRYLPRYLTRRFAHRFALGHELALVVILKVIALIALYYLFFSPAHRPHTDPAAHIMGGVEIAQPPQSSGR